MSMQEFLKFWENTSIINIIFFLLSVLGIFLTLYFYFKSKKSKIPYYGTRSINLINDKVNKIEEFEIVFREQKIKNLTITKLLFWNAGRETINRNDVASKDPLIIKINELNEFLDVKLMFSTADSNDIQFKISENRKLIYLDFEYLDHSDGFILQLYHTADSGSAIQLQGKIKGSHSIKRKTLKFFSSIIYDKIPMLRMVDLSIKHKKIALGISFILAPIILIIVLFKDDNQSDLLTYIFALFSLIITILYWGVAYRIMNSGIPKHFEKHLEES